MRNVNFKTMGKDFIDGFIEHDVMTLSAALAFYTALSLAPLLLIMLSVIGLFGVDMRPGVVGEIESLMGREAAKAITAIVNNAQEQPEVGTLAGILGVVTLLFSASGVFAQLQSSLNLIWKSANKNSAGVWPWVKQRLLSIGMVFTLAFLAIVSLLVSAVITYFFHHNETVWQFINNVVSMLIFAGLFASVFKFLPDAKLNWKNAFIGGAFTSVMFTLGKDIIGIYLGQSAVGSAYGAAGSLIMLLVWVYYSAVIFFMGAEFTRALTKPVAKGEKGSA